jgi:hypothetical protein
VDLPAGDRVLDVHPEVGGQDVTARGPVGDQPPARVQGVERVGDDLGEHVGVGLASGDDHMTRARRVICGHDCCIPPLAGAGWPVTAWAPSPMVAYVPGRRARRIAAQHSPAAAARP